jgi:hypothetical protein
MEPCVEIFMPARLYSRAGWVTLATSLLFVAWGTRAPMAYLPAILCVSFASVMFWLAARPAIRVGENQFNIGERAIAWREVREINKIRFLSPLMLRIKLTNSRQKMLVFPGDAGRVEQLIHLLRKNSHLATFDGVAYRDYWTWSSMAGLRGQRQLKQQPVRMLSSEDEDEIERMYQKLKTVGRLDARTDSASSDEH